MKKYLVEFIGTFFLVLTIVMSVLGGAGAMAPVAIGLALMVMVYAGGHISGAHYNPAVTLAVWMRGKHETKEILPYMGAQLVGGALAAVVSAVMLGGMTGIETSEATSIPMVPSLLAELLGTFALAFVVLNVATSKDHPNNSFYGLAIGLTVTAMAYSLGNVSGGAFNPAVAVGITVAEMKVPSDIWIFLVANLAGGALAALAFNFVKNESDD